MSPALFALDRVGGPWSRRFAKRRGVLDDLPWESAREGRSAEALEEARWVWTQSAFSETASAAAFAEIARALLAAGAPIDLVAAAGEFVADEMVHAELSARVAEALGGLVPLEVNREKLVRPPEGATPLLRAAELVLRTSCVGEALTIPILKSAKATASSALVERVLRRILEDESAHAELGWWFFDWAIDRLDDAARAHLGRAASAALESFSPLFESGCGRTDALGALACGTFDAAFHAAKERRVIAPLAKLGIIVRA